MRAISFMTSTVSLKNRSVMGQRSVEVKKAKFLLFKELFLTQTHTSKLKHIGRVILTHTIKEKLNKQSEKHKCIIKDTSVHPNNLQP